ncbi:hypothetical protein PMIN01_12912 [Paraphaeosphaeria minitans]|uniref:Methyltransferase domain-containing protein n=1 Tax=Paraphaeosphaeria minitans TaxID=565426 RepID=A0A9P6G5I9_9PLEO|nr:hypothetical protein PMIN01_12912 [Paraphaeosphaeria minitans]
MSTAERVKEDYRKHAETYGGYNNLPAGLLESQIIKNALGDANGLVILDLGGGSGIHAREAIDAGAQRVDIVDISPEMKFATDTEKSLGRDGRIRTFEGDVSKRWTIWRLRLTMSSWPTGCLTMRGASKLSSVCGRTLSSTSSLERNFWVFIQRIRGDLLFVVSTASTPKTSKRFLGVLRTRWRCSMTHLGSSRARRWRLVSRDLLSCMKSTVLRM